MKSTKCASTARELPDKNSKGLRISIIHVVKFEPDIGLLVFCLLYRQLTNLKVT